MSTLRELCDFIWLGEPFFIIVVTELDLMHGGSAKFVKFIRYWILILTSQCCQCITWTINDRQKVFFFEILMCVTCRCRVIERVGLARLECHQTKLNFNYLNVNVISDTLEFEHTPKRNGKLKNVFVSNLLPSRSSSNFILLWARWRWWTRITIVAVLKFFCN